MKRFGVVLLVAVVLLAGCAEPGGSSTIANGTASTSAEGATEVTSTPSGTTGTATDGDSANARATESVRGTAEPTGSPDSIVAFDTDNPWGREVVTVGVNDSAGVERNLTALVRRATEYWNTDGRGYGEYAVRYEVDPDARAPDIEVQFVREIESCGHQRGGELLGCAPQLHANSTPPTPVPVRVETGYSDESTVETIKHELGHTRGLDHDDEPAFMNASGVAYTLPQRDAVDRAYPWATSNFTVYVDASNVSAADRPAFRRQVNHAFDYYEGAPPTVPANVSYTLVGDPSEATIVVRYVDDGEDPGSRAMMQGIDVDGDGALERRTKAVVRLRGLDVDETGYHTGYWLGRLLGADDASELPPPFRGGTDPSSDWWSESASSEALDVDPDRRRYPS